MGSDLLKVARAAGGDTWFSERVQAACILSDTHYDGRRMLYHVAREVVDAITVDDMQTVDTSHVDDAAITAAVRSYTQEVTA